MLIVVVLFPCIMLILVIHFSAYLKQVQSPTVPAAPAAVAPRTTPAPPGPRTSPAAVLSRTAPATKFKPPRKTAQVEGSASTGAKRARKRVASSIPTYSYFTCSGNY
jgi:hypothetical protein